MMEPVKVDASSQPCATGMPHQSYKSLLNEQLQKLKKQLPVYKTQNEGSKHEPMFRTTVCVDGESYTSPNTFQQRKLAETDACKVALLAIMLKLKNEALNYIQQDNTLCKLILSEYAVMMNIQMPKYETTGSWSFRSSLVFNGVSYSGDECKAKKEAERLAARVVLLKCLESETGNILSEIIMSKFNYPVTKDTQIPNTVTEIPATPTVSLPPENHLFAGAQAIKAEASSSVTVSGKKRNRKSKKNAQKRIKSESQMVMSTMFMVKFLLFSKQ